MNRGGPALGRAILTWIVFIVLLSGAGMLVAEPGTAAFVLSTVMCVVGTAVGAVLLVVSRRTRG